MVENRPAAYDFDSMTMAQLEIYATELQRHFQEERRLREELEMRNQELEHRLKELTALNQLFQKHLEQRLTAVSSLQSLASTLEQLSKDATAMLIKVGATPGSPLEDLDWLSANSEHEDIPDLG